MSNDELTIYIASLEQRAENLRILAAEEREAGTNAWREWQGASKALKDVAAELRAMS